jgi:hypothetical protein
MDEQTIFNMRERAARCRRLAKSITDVGAAEILLQMAAEIEADIKRHEAAQGG